MLWNLTLELESARQPLYTDVNQSQGKGLCSLGVESIDIVKRIYSLEVKIVL